MPDALISQYGLEAVQTMLREAPRTIVARGWVRALSAGGEAIAEVLEANTPIKEEDTGGLLDRGELRESVMIEVILDSNFRGGLARVGFGKNGPVALWIEYGHRMVGHKPLKKLLGEVPQKPFMRITTDQAYDRAVAAFAQSLEETVRTEFPQALR
jgi:hypothetical protein